MRGIPSQKNKKNKKKFFENPSKTTRYAFAPIAPNRLKRQKDAQKAPVFGGALDEEIEKMNEHFEKMDEENQKTDDFNPLSATRQNICLKYKKYLRMFCK